jgi:HKD family nuclease
MENQEWKIKIGAMKNGKSRIENQERSNEEWKIKRGAMNL